MRSISIRKRTTKIISNAGPEYPDLEISGAALDDTIDVFKMKGGGYLVGYVVPDEFADDPFENDEGLGNIFTARRNGSREEIRAYERARGLDENGEYQKGEEDPDAVLLDVYSHGGEVWSIHGGGMNCPWDTAHGAGVWVPNDVIRPELTKIKDKAERQAAALKYAKAALRVFNAWINGEVFGVCVDVFDDKGKEDADACESCFGYFGAEEAEGALKEMIRDVAKTHERARGAK